MVKRSITSDDRTSKRRRTQASNGPRTRRSQPSDGNIILNNDDDYDEKPDSNRQPGTQGPTSSSLEDGVDEDEITPVHRDGSNNPSSQASTRQNGVSSNQRTQEEEEEEEEEEEGAHFAPEMRGESDSEDDQQVGDEDLQPSSSEGFASCGILSSVRLDNFMSHRCFSWDLGPNVNIVNGKNGSGKSAIIAALQLGLGGTIKLTGRAKKGEDIITNGEDGFIITINIHNRRTSDTADMTYKNDIYGDMITIERKMTRSKNGGTSTWSVRGKKKRTIKLPDGVTPRREMFNIVEHFGFMVGNPVAFLTQEKSKEFLAKGNGVQQYKLYREATLLEPLSNEIVNTYSAINSITGIIKKTEAKTPNTTRQLERLEAAHRDAQEMKTIHVRIKETVILLAWTEHREHLHNLTIRENQTRNSFEPKEIHAKNAYENANEELQEMTSQIEARKQRSDELSEQSKIAGASRRAAHIDATKAKAEFEDVNSKIKEMDQEIIECDRNVGREQVRMEQAQQAHFRGQEQKTRLLDNVKKLKDEEKTVLEEITEARGELASFEGKRMDHREELHRVEDQNRRLEEEFESNVREYDQAKRAEASKSELRRFGEDVRRIAEIIDRNRHVFEVAPIGPVGRFIKVKDESWAGAIETAISKGLLKSFLINDPKDAKKLIALLPRNVRRPLLTACDLRRSRYNCLPSEEPDPEMLRRMGYTTVIEQIIVDHDCVYNTLKDTPNVEKVVLNDRDDITNLGWSSTHNVKAVYNKKGEHATERGGSKVYRGAPRYCGDLLAGDNTRYLEQMHRKLKDVEEQTMESRQAVHECKLNQNSINSRTSELNGMIRELEKRQISLERKRQQFEDQLARADDAFDPTPFERRISDAQGRKDAALREKSQSEAQIEEAQQKVQQCITALEDSKRSLAAVNQESNEFERTVEQHANQIATVRSKARSLLADWNAAKDKLTRAYEELEGYRCKVNEMEEMAAKGGPCPDEVNVKEQPSQKVKRRVNMLQTRLRTEEQRRGGKCADEIEKEYLKAREQHQRNTSRSIRVKGYWKALKRGVKVREQKLIELERLLRSMVRFNFRRFLNTRKHTGSIGFKTDGAVKELVISVQIATHQKADGERHKTMDLRSLSGGERSFTTLCFMMALAEICQNPLRVMDEIDVYQDEANRNISFKIITDFFQKYLSDRQIVIITPHSLPNISPSPSCRIVRLPDPVRSDTERGQTRMDDYLAPTG